MALSLKEIQGLTALAAHLYDYLPASGAVLTFGSAAQEVAGVGELWQGVAGMSKLPALTHLLEATLEHRQTFGFESTQLESIASNADLRPPFPHDGVCPRTASRSGTWH